MSDTRTYVKNLDTRWSVFWDIGMKVAFPILLGVSAWTFTQLWQHEGRITVLETQETHTKSMLQKIDTKLDRIQQELMNR